MLPRAGALALICFASRCMTGYGFLCRFVKCMLCQRVSRDRVMMLYPSGCLNPITLHHHPIMFTGRSNAWHIAFRVAGFVRAGLTALPQIIQPRCDSLRYPVTSRVCGFQEANNPPKSSCSCCLNTTPPRLDVGLKA